MNMAPVEPHTNVDRYIDSDGREFGYVHVPHEGARGLVVHFSAFFGAWGNKKPYRDNFRGYFHRMKMLGTATEHNWLFLCDQYGPFDNGTYYTGAKGDFFVERAMSHLIDTHLRRTGCGSDELVTVGSSMGATAALKFGLMHSAKAVVAISPHIDLDICASRQNRMREVAFICPDGDPLAPHNHRYTRQIRSMLAEDRSAPLPSLFIQSCADDDGVHSEQVVPLCERWRELGGRVALDERAQGGHTSDYATRALLLDAIGTLLDGRAPDLEAYQNDERFEGVLTVPPLSHRIRGRLRLRSRLFG
jgi:hypothetical protein